MQAMVPRERVLNAKNAAGVSGRRRDRIAKEAFGGLI
jgi:hypothetical protein